MTIAREFLEDMMEDVESIPRRGRTLDWDAILPPPRENPEDVSLHVEITSTRTGNSQTKKVTVTVTHTRVVSSEVEAADESPRRLATG